MDFNFLEILIDQLQNATNGTFTSYYNYDSSGPRSRKVVEKGAIREERYYFGGYEVYRKYVSGSLDKERHSLHVDDDKSKVAIVETLTRENGQDVLMYEGSATIRYQYSNHSGSACLELDERADIISYEEYHPFGTTSYRAGRSEAEVSLKRYKYCGKERDEESGLYYYGMRYYADWLCRFVSVDPLQFKYPELTPFQYASNAPITFIDLDGGEKAENDNGVARKYTIKKGDTYWDLAEKSNGAYTVDDLIKWNPGINYNSLQIGSTINISDPSKNLQIGSIGTVGQAGDLKSEILAKPVNIDVKKQSNWPNDKLFMELEDALTDGTFGPQDDESSNLVAHFKKNIGENYTWSKSTHNLIMSTDAFKRTARQVQESFKKQMIEKKGLYSSINLSDEDIGRPNFTAKESISLKTLIGGTQQLDVLLSEIKINEDNTYKAVLILTLYDAFGVTEEDIRNASFAAKFGMEGLKSLWVLQHQRGFKAFKTVSNFKLTINGKF